MFIDKKYVYMKINTSLSLCLTDFTSMTFIHVLLCTLVLTFNYSQLKVYHSWNLILIGWKKWFLICNTLPVSVNKWGKWMKNITRSSLTTLYNTIKSKVNLHNWSTYKIADLWKQTFTFIKNSLTSWCKTIYTDIKNR